MTTMLIWLGSGFAFAIGFLCGVLVIGALTKKQPVVDKATEALLERNQIGLQQAHALEEIADQLTRMNNLKEGI